MSHWQHHEGAVRMLLWLFFKIRLGKQQTIAVQTLMKIAYGEAKMRAASSDRTKRKRQIRTFERDLEVLFEWGFRCQFDPVTYPPDIQPLWWKLKVVPDEGEAALEFWREDALKERSILDPAPRGKWKRLLNARFLGIDLDQDMAQHLTPVKHPKRDRSRKATPTLTGEQIKAARQCQKLSQRELARLMGKSQSWMRDIENGRLNIKPADRKRLQKILFRNS